MSGANPFDTADDVNPFGSVAEYNPFASNPSNPPSSPPSPAPPQQPAVSLDFTDSGFGQYNAPAQPDANLIGAAPVNNNLNEINPMQDVRLEEAGGYDNAFIAGPGGPGFEPLQQELPAGQGAEDFSFYQFGYYQSMFNVDTTDVLDRILRASVPFRRNFFPTIKPNPDLYGLVWICATLVFVMAASGNFANYLTHLTTGGAWSYDFSKLPYGAGVVYGYNTIIPLAWWALLAWFDDFDISFIQMLCLYGYSMFIFIPAAILSALPSDLARYISVAIAAGVSIAHLILALWPILAQTRKSALLVLIGVAALHAGLAIAFIVFFFNINVSVVYSPQAPPVAPIESPVGSP